VFVIEGGVFYAVSKSIYFICCAVEVDVLNIKVAYDVFSKVVDRKSNQDVDDTEWL
jgi:hypothetical protein